MSRYMKLLILGLVLTVIFAPGCSDRGTNIPESQTSGGGIYTKGHDFIREFLLQLGRNASGEGPPRVVLQIRTYAPEVAIVPIQGGQAMPVPLLILLPPQDGDEWYFFNHGLKQLADELIAEGTIQPMAIVCIPNDRVFGGFFYAGNSAPAGYYDYFIGGSLVKWLVDSTYYAFLNDSLPVGIGGVGMGGYGAFRAALMHKGIFSSVSVTDGPFDFDGPSGSGGFIELFDDALIEQGLLGGTTDPPVLDTFYWRCDSFNVDLECVDSTQVPQDSAWDFLHVDTTYPPSWRAKFDSSGAWHLSRLFIGAALAFSPHDTLIDTTGVYQPWDTTYRIRIPDSQRFVIDDSITLITEIVKEDQFNFDFHLPFDSTGTPYPLIWNMWLENNLERILLNKGPGQLRGVKMWFGTTPEFGFGNYRQQTRSWIEWLRGSAVDPSQIQVKEYSGYPGNPATNDQYMYDVMRDMLIFHSKSFEQKQ